KSGLSARLWASAWRSGCGRGPSTTGPVPGAGPAGPPPLVAGASGESPPPGKTGIGTLTRRADTGMDGETGGGAARSLRRSVAVEATVAGVVLLAAPSPRGLPPP